MNGDDGGAPDDRLAAFVHGLRADDLPARVVDRVKLLLLDAIASALASRTFDESPRVAAVARRLGGPGDSTVIGGEALSLVGAALLNGFQITATTMCDVHRPTLTHVTPEVVPAALAIAEDRDIDGATLLAALAAGFETTVRVSLALADEGTRARGWHMPGIAGPLGGAAAVGRLLGLERVAVRDAFGHAASQAAGTFAALGSSGVKIHQARGAVSGLLAGLLAENGLDAARLPFTSEFGGLLIAYADGGHPAALTDGLGTDWRLEEISLRRWPAASSLQAVIGAMLAIVEREGLTPDEVAKVRVRLPPASYRLNGENGWEDQLSALQSARYVAAVVLHDRRCWVDQYAADRRGDHALTDFAAGQVEVRPDPALPRASAVVTIERRDGRIVEHRQDVTVGDPALPLSWEDVQAKLRDAARGLALDVEAISDTVSGLERSTTTRSLTDLVRVPAAR